MSISIGIELYTVVKTPDERLGVYVGGWSRGLKDGQDEVVFEDGSMWAFPKDQIRRHRDGPQVAYDFRGYKPVKDQRWQMVHRRWSMMQSIMIALSTLDMEIERLDETPSCWNDEEGLMSYWTGIFKSGTLCAKAYAWSLRFGTPLPADWPEILDIYEREDEAPRRERYFKCEEIERRKAHPPKDGYQPSLFATWR